MGRDRITTLAAYWGGAVGGARAAPSRSIRGTMKGKRREEEGKGREEEGNVKGQGGKGAGARRYLGSWIVPLRKTHTHFNTCQEENSFPHHMQDFLAFSIFVTLVQDFHRFFKFLIDFRSIFNDFLGFHGTSKLAWRAPVSESPARQPTFP